MPNLPETSLLPSPLPSQAIPLPSVPIPAPNLARSPAGTERRPLPAIPPTRGTHPHFVPPPSLHSRGGELAGVPNHIPPEHLQFTQGRRVISESTIANIPSFRPPEIQYEELEDSGTGGLTFSSPDGIIEEYGRLELSTTQPITDLQPNGHSQHDPRRYNRSSRSTPALSPSPQPPWGRGSPASNQKRSDYEDLDGPLEGYGKLEHPKETGPLTQFGPSGGNRQPPRKVSAKSRPPKPAPYRPKSPELTSGTSGQEVYSEIEDSKVRVRRPFSAGGYNKLLRSGISDSSLRPRSSTPPEAQGYGVLNRRGSNSNPELPISAEHYGALVHFPETPSVLPSHQPEEYSKLEHPVPHSDASVLPSYQPEEYGKLEHPVHRSDASVLPSYQPEEYGKLEHPVPHFDPYGSLSHSNSYREGPQMPSTPLEPYEGMFLSELPEYSEIGGDQQPSTTAATSPRPTAALRHTLETQDSLPDSEEYYSEIVVKTHEEEPPRPPPPKPETLYELSDKVQAPPVPPRRARSVRSDPSHQLEAEQMKQPELQQQEQSQQQPQHVMKPVVLHKPPLKPKPKPKPTLKK